MLSPPRSPESGIARVPRCLPGPPLTHPTRATVAQEGPSRGFLKGSSQGPQCNLRSGQAGTTGKPCPAPKVTFPAPSSDGRLNSALWSLGEGRADSRRPRTEPRDCKGQWSMPQEAQKHLELAAPLPRPPPHLPSPKAGLPKRELQPGPNKKYNFRSLFFTWMCQTLLRAP